MPIYYRVDETLGLKDAYSFKNFPFNIFQCDSIYTPTKLWGSSSSRMYDLEKCLQESEHKRLESEQKRIEVDVELKEEVKHLKSMLEQQAIQMTEQRRHFEEQQASQMAAQRAHYDNMMMQMLSCITSQSAQSSSDH